MSIRYPLITQALAAAGGFVVVTTFAFSRGTANSVDFAVAIGITAVALGSIAVAPAPHRRRLVALGAATAAVGAWTILVTLGIFSGATQEWLVFASGAAIAAAGLAGTTLYELSRSALGTSPTQSNGQVPSTRGVTPAGVA
jgi:hypothetical protein